MTAASEFGGLNVSTTRLNGTTHNPWRLGRATEWLVRQVRGGRRRASCPGDGGDGGDPIQLRCLQRPRGHEGHRGPHPQGPAHDDLPSRSSPCLSRSVRDVARYYDVCAGHDSRDPYSLPKVEAGERDLGTHDLAGKRVVVAPTLGAAVVRPEVEASVATVPPRSSATPGSSRSTCRSSCRGWASGDDHEAWPPSEPSSSRLWPGCADLLSKQIAVRPRVRRHRHDARDVRQAELARIHAHETMAAIDEVDFIICATNPDRRLSRRGRAQHPGERPEWGRRTTT